MSYNRYQPFQFLKGQMWDPAQSDQKSVPNPVNMCDHVPSTHVPPCLVISFTRISRGPSQHKSGSFNNNYEYHSASQSKERKSPANVRAPSITSSEPLPKRPENPSGATANAAGRVHRGPRRDQLLDHGGVAFLSRVMQRRLASGAEDASSSCVCRRETKRIVVGCFSGLLGKILNIGRR